MSFTNTYELIESKSCRVTDERSQSFDNFYAEHVATVRRFVARLLPGSAEAEEVTNEAFTNVFQAHQAGRDVVNKGYVFAVANNLVKNIYRRSRVREEQPASDEFIDHCVADHPDIERQIISKERLDLLRKAFSLLSPLQQEIILMRKLDNMRVKDIADRKGISVSLVEKQIRYGLRACQDYLDAHEDDAKIDNAMQNKGLNIHG